MFVGLFTNTSVSIPTLELNNKVNADYQEFIAQKVLEKVSDLEDSFTIDEYYDIVDVNSGNNVEINGTKILATDFLEIIYKQKNKKLRERLVFHLINGLPFFSNDLDILNLCGKK